MQRYERSSDIDAPVHCVFCGAAVAAFGEFEQTLTPCAHTLFIADDVGFYQLSAPAASQLGLEAVSIQDGHMDADGSVDAMTDALRFSDALKIAIYTGPPARFGFYVGFGPAEQT